MSAAPADRLVSVIIPAYNAANWIGATLESVAMQTHRSIEVIVVDDGSHDRTVEISEAFARSDPRFRVVRQANAGVAAARNHGASLARADLLSFVDADDLWTPDKTMAQLAALDAAGPGVGLCYSWYVMIDGAARVIYREEGRAIAGAVLDQLFVENFVGNGSAALVRREAFDRVGGFEPALRDADAQGCEDILFYCRVAEHYGFAVATDYHIGYRQLPDNMSSDLARMLRSWFMVVDEMAARHPDKRVLLDAGLRRYSRWVTRRAVHRKRPGALLKLFALMARRDPLLTARMALIEAPSAMLEPLRRHSSRRVEAPAADDALAIGRRFNG